MFYQPLVFILIFCSSLFAVEDRPQAAKEVVQTIHRVRHLIETPERVIPEDFALIKKQIRHLVEHPETLAEFVAYAYGPGLLYLDEFYEDLIFLNAQLASDSHSQVKTQLETLDFGPLAKILFALSMEDANDEMVGKPIQQAMERIKKFEVASANTLEAEENFNQSAKKAVRVLKCVQSTAVLLISGIGLHYTWHTLGLDKLTPRELVAFLFSVWATNEAIYWTIWERFKWLDTFKQRAAEKPYKELIQAWNQLLSLSPSLTAQKAAAAATSKPISNLKHADALADAALQSLFESLLDDDTSNDAAIKHELSQVFLTELQGGNGARATRILEALKKNDPNSKAARMSGVIAKIFAILTRIERKALIRDSFKAAFRLCVLGILVYTSNETLKTLLPTELAHWRAVPNWIIAGLGVKRVHPFVWLPQPAEKLKPKITQEDIDLRAAFDELLAIESSGDTIERIAEYDSGYAAQRILTMAAAESLAAHPSGERTRSLWNLVNHELSASHPGGSRVDELLQTTYVAQRNCAHQLLVAVRDLGQHF